MQLRNSTSIIFLALSILCCEGAKALNLLPTPKEVKLKGQVKLDTDTVIITDGSQKSELGITEINRALKIAGANPFTVEKSTDKLNKNFILLGTVGKSSLLDKYIKKFNLKVSKNNPGPQGYLIYFPKDNKVTAIIVGSDDQGSLYGAITFAQLISQKDGAIIVNKADIRDWPDFKRRQIANCGMSYQRQYWYAKKTDPNWRRKHIKYQKDYIDWCLRRKINAVKFFMLSKWVGQARFPDWSKEDFSWMKELCEYAEKRGIQTVVDHARIVYLGDSISFMKKHPEIKRTLNPSLFKNWDCGVDHDLHFCWSREEMHQKQAKAYAKTIKEYFPGALIWFHLLDAPPSGSWVMRCRGCKRKFRNNRAKADTYVAMIYKKEFDKITKSRNVAFCFWPYTPRYMGYPDMVKYFKNVNKNIPKSTVILTREFNRAGVKKMRNVYKGHPFYYYVEDNAVNDKQHMASRGLISFTPTYLKACFFDNPDDVLFYQTIGDKTGVSLLDEVLGAEYSWNTKANGNRNMPRAWDFLDQNKVPKEVVARACKNIWGKAAGSDLGSIFNSGINANFICNPEKVTKHENKIREQEGLQKIQKITTLSKLMKKQVSATSKAIKILNKLFQTNVVLKPGSDKYFYHYYANLNFLNICAKINYYYLLGKELAIAGKEKKAQATIAKGFALITQSKNVLAKVLKQIAGKPNCYYGTFRVADETNVNMKSLKKRLQMISKNIKGLYQKHNIHQKIKTQILEPRTITALKVATPPVIDGEINDKAWAKAPNEKHFVCHDQLKLARAQTHVAIVYDDKNLYLRFICEDPQIKNIANKKRTRDSWSEKDDMIEIFLTPNKRQSTYCQFAASYAGTKYDCDYRDMTLGGISGKDSKIKWNPKWEIKTSKNNKAWYAEIKIPFSSLKTAPYSKFSIPKSGDSWYINLCRDWYDKKVGDTEYSSICFSAGKGFHARSKYSKLVFK